MNAFDVLSGFVPLFVMGMLTLGLVRLTRRARSDHPVDAATLTRQLVLYGLLFITMVVTASGVVWAYGELTTSTSRGGNRELAEALALLALGLPVFVVLLALADRRLGGDEVERRSTVWAGYFTLASVTSLVATMIGAYRVLHSVVATGVDGGFDDGGLVMTLTWGGFFATHWVFLRLRHGVLGDLHLASTTFVGMVALVIGQVGLVTVLGERLYDELFDRPIDDLRNTSAPWAAMFVVGCVVWMTVWLRNYESAPRTKIWHVLVVPVGALAGFVGLLGAAASMVYRVLVWLFGDTAGVDAGEHYSNTPLLLGIGSTGLVVWLYHRAYVAHSDDRSDVRRVYDYLLMEAALIIGVIGALMAGASLLDDGSTDKNLVLAGITLLALGGSVWSGIAAHVVAHQSGDGGIAELRSPVRRSYLFATLGIGTLAVLIAGIDGLERIIEDALDATLSIDTLIDQRLQLATVVIVTAVLWFHTRVYRDDQRQVAEVMPPPPASPWPSRIIVVGASGGSSIDVERHPETTVEYWSRADETTILRDATLDVDELERILAAQPTEDVLVLLNGETPTVIPFER